MRFAQGFTLVELLVVISIIAILSVIGITVFSGGQKNTRDARRRADIDAIAKAYEVRYSNLGSYGTTLIEDTAFSGNKVPTPPEGGQYTIMQDNTTKGIKVCAALEENPQRYCTDTSITCACESSSQEQGSTGTTNITYLAGGPPGGGGGGGSGGGTGGTGSSCDPNGVLTSQLAAYWKMDESSWTGASSEVKDSSGNGKDTSDYGGASITIGKLNNAGTFNGINGYLITPNMGGLNKYSITFWVKNNSSNYQFIFEQKPGVLSNPSFEGSINYRFWVGNSDSIITSLPVGEWHHIVLIYSSSDHIMAVYKDGGLVQQKTTTVSNAGLNDVIYWASRTGSSFSNITLDDVRIYSRIISAQEASILYNSGDGCAS